MTDPEKLVHPWLAAVWPGMGNVAMTSGFYLMSKLGMDQIAEIEERDIFDVEQIAIEKGLVQAARLPRSRFYAWKDPKGAHDIVVFIGEAQPMHGKFAFCHRILDYALEIGVERIWTFAAMATELHPQKPSRTFGVATDQEGVEELKRLEVEIIENGQITGLNGVLLAAAAQREIRGTGLLGEMPLFASQVPYPKASRVVLDVFDTVAGTGLDFTELDRHGKVMERKLTRALNEIQRMQQASEESEGSFSTPSFLAKDEDEDESLSEDDRNRIEELFDAARQDRSKAYELKQVLDRLDLFKQYENRFLDLFKKD